MKICLFLLSDGWGGAENVVFNLAKNISKKGHALSIILNDEILSIFKKLNNVDVYNIGPIFNYQRFLKKNFGLSLPNLLRNEILAKIPRFIFGSLLRNLNYKKIKRNVLEIIEKTNADVIHFHNPAVLEFYSYIYKQIKVPKIYTIHGKDFEKHINPFNIIFYLKKRRAFTSFDVITAVSEYGKKQLKIKKLKNPVKVIENGVDLDDIKSILSNKFLENKSNKTFKIMFPGGIKPNKGGLILLKSAEILNEKDLPIKFYYAGATIQRFIDNNETENVIFTGFLDHKKYLEKLNECDCLILLSETEQFPISILEAMALGKPIITTPVGGTPEFCLNMRNAVYVKRDPNDVVEKILYLYKNPDLRKEISRNNLQDVKRFDWGNIVDKYLELYETLL